MTSKDKELGHEFTDLTGILEAIQAGLQAAGLDVDIRGNAATCCAEGGPQVKVVCVAPGLQESVAELSRTPRDQVVMVRVDEATNDALDAWVETGAVRSRSEAAALFIREGLGIRADELARLKGALRDVERAREKLRRQAREVFGEDPPSK
jgi:hypothetical protein